MADETGAWMPMYWADYFGDTTHLSTEEHGAYLLLIGTYWRRGKALPDDDKWLATVTKLSGHKWRHVRKNLEGLFEKATEEFFDKGIKKARPVWRHKRVEIEIHKSSGRLQSARAAGKAGGLAKSKLPTTTLTVTEEEKKDSVPNGTGADAPPSDPWVAVFAEGKKVLSEVAGCSAKDAGACVHLVKVASKDSLDEVRRYIREVRDKHIVEPYPFAKQWAERLNGHGSNGKAETAGSEGRVDRVVERLKARSGQGLPERPGRDDDPVLPAVSGGVG